MHISSPITIITGAAGFIGSNLVSYYNRLGKDNIVIVDHFSMRSWLNLLGLRYKQLIDPSKVLAFIESYEGPIESIVHLGAISDTTCSDGHLIMETNYQLSIDLVVRALDKNIPFLYASSAATYGDGSFGFDDDHARLHTLKPLNLYGFSKHAFDLWLLENGLIDLVTGVKYFNIFGPGEQHKGRMASMVYHMHHQVEKKGQVRLFASNHKDYNDGGQKRDFFYVKDAVKMTAFLLENRFTGIYNVGMGEANTWNSMAENVFYAMGEAVNIEYIPMPEDLHGKYQNFTCANMDKFYRQVKERGVSFDLDYTYKSAITDYIQNHLEVEKPCNLIKH